MSPSSSHSSASYEVSAGLAASRIARLLPLHPALEALLFRCRWVKNGHHLEEGLLAVLVYLVLVGQLHFEWRAIDDHEHLLAVLNVFENGQAAPTIPLKQFLRHLHMLSRLIALLRLCRHKLLLLLLAASCLLHAIV